MATPPDTLDDWLEEWRRENDWLLDRTEVQRLVDEIERLRKDNHAFALRIQDAWKRIETLEEAGAAVVLDFDKGIPGDATPDELIEALRAAVTDA